MAKRKTQADFINSILSLVNLEYTCLGSYRNNKTHILMKHNGCGYEWMIRPDNFLSGKRCPKCAIKKNNDSKRKSNYKFLVEVKSLFGEEYSVLENYTSSHTKLRVRHNYCKHIWKIEPNAFLRGNGCPNCSISKGEARISAFLNNNSVNYMREYVFDGCCHKRKLPFDFYLTDYHILLEYDGELHYKDKFKNEDEFAVTKNEIK